MGPEWAVGADSLLGRLSPSMQRRLGFFLPLYFLGHRAGSSLVLVLHTCSGWGFHIPPPCRMLSWTGHWGLRLQSSPLLIGWPSGAFINWAFSLSSHSFFARRGVEGCMSSLPPSLSSNYVHAVTVLFNPVLSRSHTLVSSPIFRLNEFPKIFKSKSSPKNKSSSCFLAG